MLIIYLRNTLRILKSTKNKNIINTIIKKKTNKWL